MSEPEPVDERSEPEIRGGNRREDYMPAVPEVMVQAGLASGAGGSGAEDDGVFEGEWMMTDQPPGGNDPDTQ